MKKTDRLLAERLTELCGEGRVSFDEPMAAHCSFRAGGKAGAFVQLTGTQALPAVLRLFAETETPFFILGNGTNVLVSDAGYPGAICTLKGAEAFSEIALAGDGRIRAGAGATLDAVARFAEKAQLTGMEALAGIPGTVGGALTMNAGAYGTEMKDVTECARAACLTEEQAPLVTLSKSEMAFGYRSSIAKECALLFTEALFLLDAGKPEEIREKRLNLLRERRKKQPLEYPSAGSTFKRPAGHFAAKLIEEAGLKGEAIGDAQVSEKHSGFIVNRGAATASDIIALMRLVRERVRRETGVLLSPEVILLGEEL